MHASIHLFILGSKEKLIRDNLVLLSLILIPLAIQIRASLENFTTYNIFRLLPYSNYDARVYKVKKKYWTPKMAWNLIPPPEKVNFVHQWCDGVAVSQTTNWRESSPITWLGSPHYNPLFMQGI